MHNIEYLMKTYDEITPLKLDGILNDILNGPTQLDKTRASIRKLKPNEAAGIDGLPSEFYKHARGNLDAPLTAMFNHTSTVASIPTHGVRALSTVCINERIQIYQRTIEKYQ